MKFLRLRSKRIRLDSQNASTFESVKNLKSSEGPSAGPNDTLKRRYKRFSHQCLPISSIDLVFVPVLLVQ